MGNLNGIISEQAAIRSLLLEKENRGGAGEGAQEGDRKQKAAGDVIASELLQIHSHG